MLDQRLLRDDPDLIARQLARRGLTLDLDELQQVARQERDLQERRSDLQAEGNRIGKEVGQRIRSGASAGGEEVAALRERSWSRAMSSDIATTIAVKMPIPRGLPLRASRARSLS